MADTAKAFGASARNHTFTTAAESYVANGGEARYLPPIVEWMSDRPLTAIAPFDIRQMAEQLLPEAKNSTRNRQVITPARAVLSHAYDRGWGPLMRIRNLKVEPVRRKAIASPVWMFAFVKQCETDRLPHLAAMVLMMHQTGARVSEACRVHWPHVDLVNRTVLLERTKTDRYQLRHLTDELVARIDALPRRKDRPVFGYTSRYSVNDRVRAVCDRAGISYKSSHVLGRHSFANNAMAAGVDIATAMQAGGWKSSKVFLETYVHSGTAGRDVSDLFNRMRFDASL
jgi:integrase